MHPKIPYEVMVSLGFRPLVKPRLDPALQLSEAQAHRMLERIASSAEAFHTQDPFYYIAHHIMDRVMTPREVKNLLMYLCRKYKVYVPLNIISNG